MGYEADTIVKRADLLQLFFDSIQLQYNTQCMKDRTEEAMDSLDIIFRFPEESMTSRVNEGAITNMHSIGQILGFNEKETNFVMDQFMEVEGSEEETNFMESIKYYDSLIHEELNEVMEKYYTKYE